MQELCLKQCFNKIIVLQATIGIDFLSKTMYLEDRTVSPVYFIVIIIIPIVVVLKWLEKLKACMCILCSSHHLFHFHHFTFFFFLFFFYIILDFTINFVRHVIMFLVPIFISNCCFPSIPWLGHEMPHLSTFISRLATDSAAALGYSRTGTFPQPHPQLHPRLSRCCGGL